MSLTDAKRRANNKYIAANMTVLGCKMRKDKAERFKTACKLAGTTPNAVFTKAVNACESFPTSIPYSLGGESIL